MIVRFSLSGYLPDLGAPWWVVVGIAVLTDFPFLPLLAVLFVALRHVNRTVLGAVGRSAAAR